MRGPKLVAKYRAERAAHSEVWSDNGTVAKQPISRSLSASGLSLLIAMAGGLVALLAEAGPWPAAALVLGLVAVLAGVAGLFVFVYRHSRSTGDGVLSSLSRTTWAAVRLLADLVP
jgi:hypothetical protein